ncbi:MAG: ABC transporter substrate-binding protein [Chloroflexi bacterium]|nr:ABC transporter substrate-binding protein [Chloroflexota bacterium]
MSRARFFIILGVLGLVALGWGCQRATTPTASSSSSLPEPTPSLPAAATPTARPQATPAHTARCPGQGVEQVIFVAEPNAEAAIQHLRNQNYHVYAYSLADPTLYRQVADDPTLKAVTFYGSNRELTLNPAGPRFADGRLNPFADPRAREALNWLIDRDYIVQEILGGLGTPKYTPLNRAFPDYARYLDLIRPLEVRYRYNPDRARAALDQVMTELGAVKRDGRWYDGEKPVTLRFVIRTEDERKAIGDYVARQLENVGFAVERLYKTAREAFALVGGDPNEGAWHIYTAGHINTSIVRDQGFVFQLYYTPRGRPFPLWQAYRPDEDFAEVAYRLAEQDFTTLEERRELFAQALEAAMRDSARVWLVDKTSFSPLRAEVDVVADLAGGIAGSRFWPYTLRVLPDTRKDAVVIAQPSLLNGPWNPLAGSSQIYDLMPIRGTVEWAVLLDPYTGLGRPQRLARATVTVQKDVPLRASSAWVTVEKAERIPVPGDAWAGWDPVAQRFILASERFPEGAEARARIVVEYPPDLWQWRWHDGSPLAPADFVMALIVQMDVGHPESPFFDKGLQPRAESFLATFKGVRIRSWDPLVIETYTDSTALDAETLVTFDGTWFPTFRLGPAPWHMLALGLRARATGQAAFSRTQADKDGVEWLNYIDGPSLAILQEQLDAAEAEAYVPYAALRPFLRTRDVLARWENYRRWVERFGHFWIGMGPYRLEQVHGLQDGIVLGCNPDYRDPVDKWAHLRASPLPQARLLGPKSGAFQIILTRDDGTAYPREDVDSVRFFFWQEGRLLAQGEAEPLPDPAQTVYRVPIPDAVQDVNGAVTVEVAVLSRRVSMPVLISQTFVPAR